VNAPFAQRTTRLVARNGSILLALENHFNPTLALSGTLRAGSAHSPESNPILAALTAQMLEKGTRRRSKLALAGELENRGISISFSASGGDPDTMDVSLSCLSRDRTLAFEALVEMLTEPSFPKDELAREKERLIGAVRQLSDQTGWRSSTAASRLIYPVGHPYCAESAEEIVAAIEKTAAEDLAGFHHEFYRASTLILAVVGDVDRKATVEELADRLTPMPDGTPPVRDIPAVPPPTSIHAVVRMKEKVNADVLLAHDSRLRRTDPDFLASTLGVAALGQSTLSSRLGLRVRDTEGLTYGINARISAGRYSGPFAISMTVAPANLSRAVTSARAVLSDFLAGGITEPEMQNEKRSRIGKFKVDLASNSGISGALDMAETYGFGVEYLDAFPSMVQSIARDEVNAAVRTHIRPGELVEVAAGEL
jgi:zinc protease